jgi:hypothetical protein
MSLLIQPSAPVAITTAKNVTLNVNNTTGSIVAFTITGSIRVLQLYAVVTTVLSANITAAHWRINDQAATIDISLNTGTTLSAAPVGSLIMRTGLAAAALTLKSNAAGAFQDAASAGNDVFTPFVVVKKIGATTTIDFRYSTTDAPSSGVLQHFIVWQPLSADAAVA